MNLRFDSCPNCFAILNGRTVCSNCGMEMNKIKEYSSAIEPFILLNNKYLTGRVLGKGGFGITYLAQNIENGKLCCIKEYMPAEYSKRISDGNTLVPMEAKHKQIYEHGKRRFIEEAGTLVKLQNNQTVVNILDYFEQNNTAYFVMEYLNGVSMKRLTSQYGGKLPLDIANKILEVIGVALIDVHAKGMLHRDLSPENIFITKQKEIKLIDFGAARDYIKAQNQGMSVVLKTGYAPPEQYSSKGVQGPWTDIYALAATYYTCVSGEKLLDSMFILKGMKQTSLFDLNCGVDKHTSDVIERAMAINYKDRYQSVYDFIVDLRSGIPDGTNIIHSEIQNIQSEYSKYAGIKHTSETQWERQRSVQKKSYEPKQQIVFEKTSAQNMVMKPIIQLVGANYGRRKVNVPDNYTVRVGRSNKDCDFVVDKDTIISRVHILIAYEKKVNKFIVTDKSANGSFLSNGMKLQKNVATYIEPGTVIYLADKSHGIKLTKE